MFGSLGGLLGGGLGFAVGGPAGAAIGAGLGGAAGGLFGGGGLTESSNGGTVRTEPWGPAQPYLADLAERIGPAFGDPDEYGPSRVAGFTPEQMQALQGLAEAYRGGTPGLSGAAGTIAGIAGGAGGSSVDSMLAAYAGGGAQNPFGGLAVPGIAASVAPAIGNEQLSGMIAGDYLSPDSNPLLRQTFDAAAGDVTRAFQEGTMPAINAQFSAAGRGPRAGEIASNSYANVVDMAQGNLGDTLGDLATSIYGPAYQQERGYQNQAISLANSLRGQGLDRALGFGNFGAGLYSEDVGRSLGATGLLANLERGDMDRSLGAAFGAPAALRDINTGDMRGLFDVGTIEQSLDAARRAEDADRFGFEQNEARNRLMQEAEMLFRLGGLGGTQNSNTTTEDPLAFLRVASGAAGMALPFFA